MARGPMNQTTPITGPTGFGKATGTRIEKALQNNGQRLPCTVTKVTGAIVEVNFEITSVYTLPKIRVPLLGSEYVRLPIQLGCKGFVTTADAYLGGMSGLGGGTADLTPRGNLSCLVFVPIGNANWMTVDPNSVVIYGPGGAKMMNQAGDTFITLTTGSISMSAGGHTLVINNTGVVIDGKVFLTHEHALGGEGPNPTGGVV